MLLAERMLTLTAKIVSVILIITTQTLYMSAAWASANFQKKIAEANTFSNTLYENFPYSSANTNGDITLNGEVISTSKEVTGQKDDDYIPATTDTYGSDANTIIAGQRAQSQYESKAPETSGEIAYDTVKRSFARQKSDLRNDPIWGQTDNVFENLVEIAKDFSECKIVKQVISSGNNYHVPKYERCEKIPVVSQTVSIGHDYEAGIIRHKSGPFNILSCGDGCIKAWIGTVGDNYWAGWCTLYEEEVVLEVIQPNAVVYAELEFSKFDDYHQVWMNSTKVYNGPNGEFPPEIGTECELGTSWEIEPGINVTGEFQKLAPLDEMIFKTRTSVAGNGEGYSRIKIQYDPDKLIFNDVWTDDEQINKVKEIQQQVSDGYCSATITCANMPSLDSNGCTSINGFSVCENDFSPSPIAGISPFCKRIDVVSDCGFNQGEICTTNMDGVENCFDNKTVTTNGCEAYENDSTCGYIKTECVDGAVGASGECYVQTDTYDCGFNASTGNETVDDVLLCDGEIQCIGESCYSPSRDKGNDSFAEVNAYLQMLQYARNDLSCQNVPERSFDPDSPPDRFYPVPSCPSGFEYNKYSDICLKASSCDFDESNFYAAGQRNGIQVVSNDAVVHENTSTPICIPVNVDGVVYTCGDSQQRLDSDTYYRVCKNESAAVDKDSCPPSSHQKNTNGICEVPPISSCPDGYLLLEGDNQFSSSDDMCRLEIPVTLNCDKSHETYDETLGICKGILYATAKCSAGYTLNGSTCTKQQTSNVTYSCPSGSTLNGSVCKKTTSSCKFSQNNSMCDQFLGAKYYECRWNGKSKLSTASNNWKLASDGAYYKAGSFVTKYGYRYTYKVCQKKTSTTQALKSCPSGYTLSNSTCTKSVSSKPFCQSGYNYNTSTKKCEKATSSNVLVSCNTAGTSYHAPSNTCRLDIPATQSCPSLYPVWNEDQSRCVSASLSPLANTEKQPINERQLLNEILSPFEITFDTFFPKAYAADITSEAPDIQASMTEYIGDKFIEIKKESEENMEDVVNAQAQLASYSAVQTAAKSARSTRSLPAATPSPSNTGVADSNVTCELFKGTAGECKIAVGGMQDCCESPVAVSLGDYITLTQKMISMDHLTAELELIEGYNGVWNTATDYVADGFSSIWSSPADAAQATSAASGEGAQGFIGEAMTQFSQSVMTIANEWLKEAFGEQVAKFFFEEVGKNAVGDAVVGASPQMGAVGSALMVVYYAYLAYVVFNLLIGIIYECTDEEMDLAMKRELLSTHYIGTYCKQKVLGACIEKRESHCVFDSPMSRIMMEEIYKQPQMGLDWGSPENPNCSGLELNDVEDVNWDNVNLDEWIGILVSTGNFTDQANINIDSLTGSGSYITSGQDRPNVSEVNIDRAESVDADEIKREVYEDAWNEKQ
ncbi:conjugal transfer protein TraN [Psychromonas aquimarina]|uniref:conjugal transfer protein TraN n=1 Tax=Psychromonas aquimarina TaxID=444919 RepID=UPI000403186C|nr:conjugal transfer protein TraN [Psychromonas aquimarina]